MAKLLVRVRRTLRREVASDRAVRRAAALICYLALTGFGVGVFTITLLLAPTHKLETVKELGSLAVDWYLLSFTVASFLVLLRLLFGGDTITTYRATIRLGALVLLIDVVAAGWSLIDFRNEFLRIDPPLPLVFLVLHSVGFWALYGLRPPSQRESHEVADVTS